MTNTIRINNRWQNRAYRTVVIGIYAILLIIGPFSQTILSIQLSECKCCNPCKCCCTQPENRDFDEIHAKCGCEISDTPQIPQLPLGLNHEPISRVDISFSLIESRSFAFNFSINSRSHKSYDYSIGLKAPPLYLINSTFLI